MQPWGFGAYVNAPGNGTAQVKTYTNMKIAVWGNDELMNHHPNLTMVLVGPAISGCAAELVGSVAVSAPGVQNYAVPLAGLTLAMQLRRRVPTLDVLVLERRTHPVPAATPDIDLDLSLDELGGAGSGRRLDRHAAPAMDDLARFVAVSDAAVQLSTDRGERFDTVLEFVRALAGAAVTEVVEGEATQKHVGPVFFGSVQSGVSGLRPISGVGMVAESDTHPGMTPLFSESGPTKVREFSGARPMAVIVSASEPGVTLEVSAEDLEEATSGQRPRMSAPVGLPGAMVPKHAPPVPSGLVSTT